MKTFEKAKQEFINVMYHDAEDGYITILPKDEFESKLTALLEAHSEQVEQDKWKAYPENKPTEGVECAVIIDEDSILPDIWVFRSDMNKLLWDKYIKMFYELPKPYKPE